MPRRIIVSPRFELFLAFAAVLRAGTGDPLWLTQARRKLDQATRRRLGDLALASGIWPAFAAVPEAAALDGDTDAVIAAFAQVPTEDFAQRCRLALRNTAPDPALARLRQRLDDDPAGLQRAAVDALRRFDRLAFAALWRRALADLEQAAAGARADSTDAIVFPSLFGEHRFRFGDLNVLTAPPERLVRAPSSTLPADDPAAVFRALGDATRYAIARLIAREALTGADLARRLGVSGPTLTHHLHQLRAARLVLEERRGNSILLQLDRRTIETLSATAAADLFGAQPIAIRRSRRA
jgi:DNA-binding transcriptional ArsR family regulator